MSPLFPPRFLSLMFGHSLLLLLAHLEAAVLVMGRRITVTLNHFYVSLKPMPGSPTPAPFYPPTHPEKSQFSSVTKSCAYSPLIVISHDSRNTGQQSPDPLPTGQVKTFPPPPLEAQRNPSSMDPELTPLTQTLLSRKQL